MTANVRAADDANLIAAAPELLQACLAAEEQVPDFPAFLKLRAALRRAVAKARPDTYRRHGYSLAQWD